MNRRKALQHLAALFAVWPGISLGQSPNRVPVIGVPLIYAGPNDPLMVALREGLRERGYVDGENIRIEHRFAEGKIERLDALVQELVRLNVDIFVAGAAPIARAQRRASATTPIVLVSWDYDPVAVGIIETMSRPGGNITGIYPRTPETLGKRLQMLKEVRPGLSRVAAVYDRWGKGQLEALETPANALGLRIQAVELRDPYDYDGAFRSAKSSKVEAALITFSPRFYVDREKLAAAALASSLPTVFYDEATVRAGGLMSYGPTGAVTWKRAGYFIDRILKGDKARDLPMEQPQVFKLLVNLKTAKALGLRVPDAILLAADEVIR